VLASDDVIFAWAIGKALLIVIVSPGALVYVAWAVIYKHEPATHVGISKDRALKYNSPVKAVGAYSLETQNWTHVSRSSPLRRRSVCRTASETVVVDKLSL
jgi:hypothetical protein